MDRKEQMSLNKKLIERAKEHNIELSESQALQLESFAKLLIEENQKYNLTALTQQDEIIDKHFIDSLKGLRYINKQYKIVDIGSGAGFPAIPLKIVSGGKYLLLDSLNKRIGFLNMAIQELGLEDIQTLHSRIEDAAHKKEYRHKFDLVLARAVAPLNILVEYALPFLKKGGKLIAYKGKKLFEEIQETTNALKIMGGEIEDKLEYQINGEKRYIISIKSLHEGHEGYPRPLNKPRKRPL